MDPFESEIDSGGPSGDAYTAEKHYNDTYIDQHQHATAMIDGATQGAGGLDTLARKVHGYSSSRPSFVFKIRLLHIFVRMNSLASFM
jgi:hypothetical protein